MMKTTRVIRLLREAYTEAYKDALRNEDIDEEDVINSMECAYIDSKTAKKVMELKDNKE